MLQLKDKAEIVFDRPIITKQRQIALKVHRRAGMNEGRFDCGKSFQLRDQTVRQVRACFAQVSLRASGEPEARARCLIRIVSHTIRPSARVRNNAWKSVFSQWLAGIMRRLLNNIPASVEYVPGVRGQDAHGEIGRA
ncbi:hypothetical protein LJR010_006582 [Ensifer adhaerens]|uniref:hypothetical protein n=1 Tax=Ensifer adhaerens TaxID=106592 RepID=UPI003ECE3E38